MHINNFAVWLYVIQKQKKTKWKQLKNTPAQCNEYFTESFYHTMLCGAVCGYATVCCLYVCTSACLSMTFRYCDRIGWNTSKIISWLNSLRYMLRLPQYRLSGLTRTPQKGGIGVASWAQKPAISLKCKIGPKLPRQTDRKLYFRLVPKWMTLDDHQRPKCYSCRN